MYGLIKDHERNGKFHLEANVKVYIYIYINLDDLGQAKSAE